MQYPKDFFKNIKFRLELTRACREDHGLAADVRALCKSSILFWLNFAGWTHDPRKVDHGEEPVIPFVTYPFQDEALLTLDAAFGREDVCVVKSRDMGASWMIMALFCHRFQFHNAMALGVVSREQSLVDGSPKSLFHKIDLLLKHQPAFLVPKYTRKENLFRNDDNGSAIEGTTTTGNVFRGDRYTAVMMDEYGAFEAADSHKAYASSQSATNCRIFNSTPQGANGAFYEAATNPHIKRIDLHWSKHPEKCKGLYHDAQGKPRSPWYDRECNKMPIPALIAQELDLDFAGSSSPFFPPDVIDKCLAQDVRPPQLRGRLEFDEFDIAKGKFVEDEKGDLLLWMFLPDGKVPSGEYVIGADISAGTGATNSTLSIADKITREKVGEFASPHLSPDKFADLAVALCHFFHNAYLIWEMNGPGGTFGKQVITRNYRNIYYRQDEQGLTKKISANLIPGWYSSTQNKLILFRDYVSSLKSGSFVNRSRDALAECRQYVYLPTGSIGNQRAQAIADPSGARENHGDRPTADALANKGLGAEKGINGPVDEEERLRNDPPMGSLAWRRRQAEEEERLKNEGNWESPKSSLRGWEATQDSPW